MRQDLLFESRSSDRLDRAILASVIAALAWIAAVGIQRAPEYDDLVYYLPTYWDFAASWPSLVTGYHAPLPAGGLWLYGSIYRLSGHSVPVLRMLSGACVLGVGCVAWAHARRHVPAGRRGTWLVLLMTYPTLATAAFSIKLHALAAVTCASALALRMRSDPPRRVLREAGGSALMCLAVLIQQPPAALACHDLAEWSLQAALARRRTWVLGALRALPLAVLGGLMLTWGGLEPPWYRGHGRDSDVGAALQLGQISLTLIVTGAWITPWLGVSRTVLRTSALAWIPCTILVHGCGILDKAAWNGPYMMGPIRELIDRVSFGSGALAAALAGASAALGLGLLLDSARRPGRPRSFVLLTTIYAGMMSLVPYHYEQYYLILILCDFFILSREGPRVAPRLLMALRLLVVAYGLLYAWKDAHYANFG